MVTFESRFTKKLDKWFKIYEDFTEELTVNPITGECFYKHQKLRAAYNSLEKHIPYLFTYKNKKYKHLNIQNTTNSIEGGIFYHMKNKISLHRGIPKGKKLEFVDFYLK